MESLERDWNTLREKFSDEELVPFVDSFYSSIEKKRRTNAEIQLKLWRRSIKEIIASWETWFMWSCVDSTLAFLQKLRESWVNMKGISLWCELLKLRSNWVYTIHFFVKDSSSKPDRIIDFIKAWEIAIYDSEYKNPKDWKEVDHIQNIFLSADSISCDDSLLTIAKTMNLPVDEEYFSWYIKKIQIDNTDETYERFCRYESWLRIIFNNKVALFKPVEEQKLQIWDNLADNLNLDSEHREFYKIMNELWWIIWHLYWYPYWVVVGVDRALRSESDSMLEKESRQDFLLWTHQDLLEKYWLNDAIEVTFIKLKSWAEIEFTNTVKWQKGTWNSLESLMNYANRELQYNDKEKYDKFYDLWFQLQKFWKTSTPSKPTKTYSNLESEVKKNTDIESDENWTYHYTHEGD